MTDEKPDTREEEQYLSSVNDYFLPVSKPKRNDKSNDNQRVSPFTSVTLSLGTGEECKKNPPNLSHLSNEHLRDCVVRSRRVEESKSE